MKIEFSIKRGRLYDGGNRILRYKICLPHVEGCDRINRLYKDIAERCEGFCRGQLLDELKERGGEYVYELTYVCTHDDGEALALLMRVRLISSGRVEREQVRAQTWSLCEQDMIPPRYVIKRYGGKGKRGFKKTEVFLCDGKISELSANAYDLFCQKKSILSIN